MLDFLSRDPYTLFKSSKLDFLKRRYDMNDNTREPIWARCGDTTPRDWHNMKRLLGTLLLWAVTFVGSTYLLKHHQDLLGPAAWPIAAVPTLTGLLAILAFRRYLQEADELQRIIQLNALALGFGGGLFAMAGYQVFEKLGAPPADVGDFIMVMAILYSAGSVFGWRRYC